MHTRHGGAREIHAAPPVRIEGYTRPAKLAGSDAQGQPENRCNPGG